METSHNSVLIDIVFYWLFFFRRKLFPMRWFILSLCLYFVGFCVWNVDNVFCGSLRDTRQHLSVVVSPVTQLHAWWHFFAGYGTYLSILYMQEARMKVLGQPGAIKLGVLGLYFDMEKKQIRDE